MRKHPKKTPGRSVHQEAKAGSRAWGNAACVQWDVCPNGSFANHHFNKEYQQAKFIPDFSDSINMVQLYVPSISWWYTRRIERISL